MTKFHVVSQNDSSDFILHGKYTSIFPCGWILYPSMNLSCSHIIVVITAHY